MNSIQKILDKINKGEMILFLGSGSTRACKKEDGTPGLTGWGLASEILKEVNRKKDPDVSVSLSKAAEFFVAARPTSRIGLDELIKQRLTGLQPTLGHYLMTLFPWKAIITTNYNTVVEDAYKSAENEEFGLKNVKSIRSDEDLANISKKTDDIILYKPHGCISSRSGIKDRLIITAKDYFDSIGLRPEMYKVLNSLVKESSTLFIGYSMDDYTFRNIYYGVHDQLGSWKKRSYNVAPVKNELLYNWTERALDQDFNTTAINSSFDAFMMHLVLQQEQKINQGLKKRINSVWKEAVEVNKPYMDKLDPAMIDSL